MTCICDYTWRAVCAIKDAITSPCTSADDNQPLAASTNTSYDSSNIAIDVHVIEADLGVSNPGLEDDSFTTGVLEHSSSGTWRPVLRFHDPVTEEPHTDSGHWTNPSLFTEVDLGDGALVDEVDGIGGQTSCVEWTDSRSTTRESGYGRSLDDSNGSSSTEPSVTIAYQAPSNTGVSTPTLTADYKPRIK